MDHIRVLICRVDDQEQMSEVAAFDMAGIEEHQGAGEHTLDALEGRTQQTGNAILRRLLQAQWVLIDNPLTEAYVQAAAPTQVRRDGHAPITVATRFGRVELSRQVCVRAEDERHVIPGNAALPDHQGMLISRGLQEWACLLVLLQKGEGLVKVEVGHVTQAVKRWTQASPSNGDIFKAS